MAEREPLVELRSVKKDYHGLRPLRVEHLDVYEGQSIALLGFDQASAEVLVNLITGAMLPDSGDIRVMGKFTRDIPDSATWLHTLDQFGLVSERAVFLDQMTAEQNLAVPFSLELEELPPDVRSRVRPLAEEVGLGAHELHQPIAALPAAMRLRVRLGRALAMNPRVLLAEHPNASLPPAEVPAFAADLARIVAQRGLASLVITADVTFARAAAEEVLTLQPATGELKRAIGWRRWFS
jgi:ABC-type transporter Mla maintaining outer membrane lipid asymmetry ATPase subunit MlaF